MSEPSDPENQLCLALYRASRAVIRSYGPLLSELGLTYPQYVVMLVLWQSPAPSGVSELGRQLGLDSGTLTPLLRRLETQGLVSRARANDDERRVLISVTAQGRALRERVATIPQEMADRFPLTAKQRATLRDELNRITETFEGSASAMGSPE